MEDRISDKVNMDTVEFVTNVRGGKTQRAVVKYSPSMKSLYFNSKMMKLLQIEDWKDVVVGYDKASKVILLRKASPEEFGTVRVCAVSKDANARRVKVRHCFTKFNISPSKHWRAQANGNYIFLEPVNESKQL